MPKIARQEYDRYYNSGFQSNNVEDFTKTYQSRHQAPNYKATKRIRPKAKKKSFKQLFITLSILAVFLGVIMPYSFKNVTKAIFNPAPYKQIQTDLQELATPTLNYISNSWFLGKRLFSFSNSEKNSEMEMLKENVNMPVLEQQLKELGAMYTTVKPSVFVWDYDTQNYVNINASEIYATASIIKIPVLIELFKSIEAGEVSIDETMPLTEVYRTEGSGSMQFRAENSQYTIDELARRMITESDNSATNMLIARVGSMTDVNQAIRNWGLKNTQLHNWLPDYNGTNITTAKEMATMLYNIDENNKFLSEDSRTKILNYMGHVHNNRLIHAGLGAGAVFLHKTGDIGSMLGDAGIVITPQGKKYIVVILANRPHNSIAGKDYIVKASEIIYNYMVK